MWPQQSHNLSNHTELLLVLYHRAWSKILFLFKSLLKSSLSSPPESSSPSAHALGLNLPQIYIFFEKEYKLFENVFDLPCTFNGHGQEGMGDKMYFPCSLEGRKYGFWYKKFRACTDVSCIRAFLTR